MRLLPGPGRRIAAGPVRVRPVVVARRRVGAVAAARVAGVVAVRVVPGVPGVAGV